MKLKMLAPILPRALGTGDVEAASGFVLTLARRHSVITTTLLRSVIAGPGPEGFDYPGLARRTNLVNVDGYGKFASQISLRLENLTQIENLGRLTLLKLSDALNPMGHAALHKDRHWCDRCLLQDLSDSGTPYQRLSWCVRSSTYCPRHSCRLSHLCPSCNKCQPYFPSLPFVAHCNFCGQRLSRDATSVTSQDNIDLIKSIYIHDLIAALQTLDRTLDHQALVSWLNTICSQYNNQPGLQSLPRVSAVDPSNLRRWLAGETKPSLDMLMHFCATLRCSPSSIITGQSSLIDFDALRRADRAKLSVRVKRSDAENNEINHHLRQALRRPLATAPSLKAVAREIGCNWTYLLHRFPEIAAQVRTRGEKSRAAAADARLAKYKAQLSRTLIQLERAGVYPSARNIRRHSSMSARVLAKPALRKMMEDSRARALRRQLSGQASEAKLGRSRTKA